MAYADIPVQCRGTVSIGHTQYHYRLDQYGQLMLVAGKDPRDWSKIDSGALDYTRIAAQEHQQPGFQGHDGPKIDQACHLCHPSMAVVDGQTVTTGPRSRNRGEAIVAPVNGDTPTAPANSEPPATPDPITVAEQAQRRAEAEAAQLRAMLDHQDRDRLAAPPGDGEAPGATVEIGGQVMTVAQFDAARHPLTTPDAPALAEGQGIDPWTKETVPITRVTGADPLHPYGKKADGSPRKRPGRGQNP